MCHSKNSQSSHSKNSQSLSFPPTLSLSLTLTLFHLAPSHSHSLSLHRRLSLSLSFPHLQLHRRHPSAPSPSPLRFVAIAVPTTAGYHSHLISSMWFLGFISLYEWLFGLSLCFREMGCCCWFCLFFVSYVLLFLFFWCNMNWVKCLNRRLMGFWIFIFIKCLLLLLLLLYISVIWIEYETWYAQIMVTSK